MLAPIGWLLVLLLVVIPPPHGRSSAYVLTLQPRGGPDGREKNEEEKEDDVCRTEELLGPIEPALYLFVRRRTGRYQLQVDGG